MHGLAFAVTCTLMGATLPVGSEAPDIYAAKWVLKPEVNLRALRGRKAIVALFNTAC